MAKKITISNKNIQDILENNDDSILMFPHTYAKVNKKNFVPSIIIAVIAFILVIFASNYTYNYFFPKNVIMKIGDITITKDKYDAIYNADIFPVKDEIFNSLELTDVDKEEELNNSDYYSRENINYIKERILLGLKAKELGYKADENIYNEKQSSYGELFEYFALANSLENSIVVNSYTALNKSDKKQIYKNNMSSFIDFDESTITYQKYYTDVNFNPINKSKIETITQSYTDFSLSNYVVNVPTADSYYNITNDSYIYFKVIENNVVNLSFEDAEPLIEEDLSFMKTDGILEAYLLEMSNKYTVKLYV